ncbi:MAG: PAS domain S-box protein [Candidatus Cloacimonetes bacterium]|nr:PAS domain S-box protein [Candidatus Cloacimonadota bacterium]
MDKETKILILEDLPTDAELTMRELQKVYEKSKFEVVDTEEEFINALENFHPDVIISDYKLPDFDGLTALRITQERRPHVPFVILTGSMNEDTAVECMKAGADDYVIKEHIKRLNSATIGAIEKKRIENEKRLAEKNLIKSEIMFRSLFETAAEGILAIDIETGKFAFANPAVCEMFGYAENELLDLYAENIHPKFYWELMKKDLEDCIMDKKNFSTDIPCIDKTGKIFYVEIKSVNTLIDKRKYHIGFFTDITERKRAEQERRDRERLLKTMAENYPNSFISIIEKDLKVGYSAGQEFKKQNLDPNSFIGLDLQKVFGEQTPIVKEHYLKTFEGQEQTFELLINNQYQLYKTVPLHDDEGIINRILSVVENITERKEALKKIKHSEEKFRYLFNNTGDAIFIHDLKGKMLEVNDIACTRLGYSKSELMKMTPSDIDAEEFSALVEKRIKFLKEKGKHIFESAHRSKDGKVIPVEINSQVFQYGEKAAIISTARDITTRKRNEELIKKRSRFQKIRADLWKIASDTTSTEPNLIKDMLKQVGIALDISRATFLSLNNNENKFVVENQWYQPEAGPSKNRSIKPAMAKMLYGKEYVVLPDDLVPGIKQYVEKKFKKDDIYSYLAMPYGEAGNPKGIFTYSECRNKRIWDKYEIEALKELVLIINFKSRQIKAFEKIRESEALLSEAQKMGKIGSWEFDIATGKLYWSDETYTIYERPIKLGPPSIKAESKYYEPEQAELLREYKTNAIEKGLAFEYDLTLHVPKSKIKYCFATMQPIQQNGKVIKLRGTVQDITKRKVVEQELQISEKKYRDIITLAPIGFYQTRRDGKFLLVNETLAKMLGYTNTSELLNEGTIENLYLDKTERERLIRIYDEEGEGRVYNVEVQYKHKDGTALWVLLTSQSYKDEEGNTNYFEGFVVDISELKKAQHQIEKDLAERETLIKELYHRTKNNMQVITSLISLKARTSKNEELFQILKEIKLKIESMSLVHSKLYQSKDLSRINLKEYIYDLSQLIISSYGNKNKRIRFNYNMESVFTIIDIAIPLGLIINEILINSYKYAWPNSETGNVKIKLDINKDKMITLSIRDDGVGLRKNFDIQEVSNLGLETIYMLCERQLDGKLTYVSNNGLEWRLVIPNNLDDVRV